MAVLIDTSVASIVHRHPSGAALRSQYERHMLPPWSTASLS